MFSRNLTAAFRPTFNQVTRTRFAPRAFTTSLLKMVKAGDPIPNVELAEHSPGNKINLLDKERLGQAKGLIIGVPAAFSPSCSEKHIPEYIKYIKNDKKKTAGDVYVVSINDAFVMKAWGKSLDPEELSKIHFVADANGAFTNALDLGFDATALLGNVRSKRYALVVDNGKVKSVHVEPDNTGVKESAVEKVLGTSSS